jgi:GNAT superfamily N-acetyltransferase
VEARVRQIRRGEVAAAALLLARAFAADPFIGHFMADPRRRRLALPPFFAAVLHELIESQAVYVSEHAGSLAGVAAWLPPEPETPSRGARWRSRLASARVQLLFPRSASHLRAGFDALGEQHPREPHWYLAFVGIDPDEQRRGLGRRLLQPVLDQADRTGDLCYLETPFPETRAFYRKLRFDETAELRPVAGAPPVWTMTRRPPNTLPHSGPGAIQVTP